MEVYFLKGFNQQAAGHLIEAIETYKNVINNPKIDNFLYSSLKNSASIYLSINRDSEAMSMFESIMTKFENNDLTASVIIWMAENYLRNKHFNEITSILKKVDLDNSTQSEKAAIAFLKAEALTGNEKYSQAIKEYESSLSLESDGHYSSLAKLKGALCLKYIKKYDQAISEFTEIIDENPDNHTILVQARFALAQIEELKNNFDSAIKYYMLVAVLYEDKELSPEALFSAGHLFERQGKIKEAIKVYKDLINKYNQSTLVNQAKERIQLIREQ